MAAVTGPIQTLPGSHHTVPEDTQCDKCCLDATYRIQGETDSFGSEMLDFCVEHYREYCEEVNNTDTSGSCDWCGFHADALIPHRDYEEGCSGRLYSVCKTCIEKEDKALEVELREMGALDDSEDIDYESDYYSEDSYFDEEAFEEEWEDG